jgi:hypothetical protein
MPDIKFTYEITAGNLIAIVVLLCGLVVVVQRVLPPIIQAFTFLTVLMAEHRLLVADYAERHGIDATAMADLAVAELQVQRATSKRRR